MTTDTSLAIAASKRLKLPASMVPAIQSHIPAALSNLAKQTAADPRKRNLLMTDPTEVTLNVEIGLIQSGYSLTGTVDLSSIVATYGVMLDTLQFGSIFHQYQVVWDSSDVATGAWPTGYIEIAGSDGAFNTADPVSVETSGSLPTNLSEGAQYYILINSLPGYGFATSAANAEAGTSVTLGSAGTGGGTIFSNQKLLQWLTSPNQGLSVSCLPFQMLQGWLEGYVLHLKGINLVGSPTSTSVLSFNVPFIPKTVADLPNDADLLQDALDCLVGVVLSADPSISEQDND